MRNPIIYAAADIGGHVLGSLPNLPMVHVLVDRAVELARVHYDATVEHETEQYQRLYFDAIRAVALGYDQVRGMPRDQIGPAFRRVLTCR